MNNAFVQQGQLAVNFQTIRSIKYDRQYKILDQIGSGAEGIVYKGEEISSGPNEIVAIKLQRILNQQSIVEQFSQKKFKNIINVRDIITTPSGTYVIMDYADGEFFKYMQSEEFINKSTREKTDLFKQIVCGVEELHEMKIIHRDLKPENILYIRQNNGSLQLKLADFGLIKRSNIENPLKTANIGTPYYWAPEMISLSAYTNYADKIDIWALGMMWYEMIKGIPMLLEYQTVQNIKQHLLNLKQNWINEQVDKVSEFNLQEKNILKTQVLQVEANKRLTAKQFKEKLIEIQNQQSGQNNQFFENNKPPLQQENQLLKFNPFAQNQIPFKQGNNQSNSFSPQSFINNPIQPQFNQQLPQQQFNDVNTKQIVPQKQSQFLINKQQIQPFPQQIEFNEGNRSFSVKNSGKQQFQQTNHQSIEVCLTIPRQSTIQVQNELKQTQEELREKKIEIESYKKEQDIFRQKITELKNIFELQLFQNLTKIKEDFENNLKLKENQTRSIQSKLRKYIKFSRKNFNKKIIGEQILQLQSENEKIRQQNKNYKKELEEKQQFLNQKYQIESQLQDKIQEIQKQEKLKQNLELEVVFLRKNIEELNNTIQFQNQNFALSKQQLDQSIDNLNNEKNKLKQIVEEQNQEKQNLLYKLEQNNWQKAQQDLYNEKKLMINQLIKFVQQILQFQVIYYSNKETKISSASDQENLTVKQYLDFLQTLKSEQKAQNESIKKNEIELLEITNNNPHQLNELFKSVQKVAIDVCNNIHKSYLQMKQQKMGVKNQRQCQVKQEKELKQNEEKSAQDFEIEKQMLSQTTLYEIHQLMQLLYNQLISKSDDGMKTILAQILNFQNQFQTDFFQTILLIASVKQRESKDEITQRLKNIVKNFEQNTKKIESQLLQTKIPQLENNQESLWAEEINRLQNELDRLEIQNSNLNFQIVYFPNELETINQKLKNMIDTILQFKQNEATQLRVAKKEYSRNEEAKVNLKYFNLLSLLEYERELTEWLKYFQILRNQLEQNKKIMEEKKNVETQIRNNNQIMKEQNKQIKKNLTFLKEPAFKPPFK